MDEAAEAEVTAEAAAEVQVEEVNPPTNPAPTTRIILRRLLPTPTLAESHTKRALNILISQPMLPGRAPSTGVRVPELLIAQIRTCASGSIKLHQGHPLHPIE